ncbi:MAG TPA: IS110 family transposase [Candidatus Binatia bacterium]|jgi:transposase|nr:IS110 family transposase [Candidatus Binatia bacterium]
MAPRKRKGKVRPPQLAAVNLHAAGIDIGATEHWVAVPADCDPQPVRRFGACTADLEASAEWLSACGVTTVAMESTGVYWIPLFELLEARGFAVVLADAREVQRAPGRPKSDVQACQWLQRLHTYGLLAAAFRPPEQVCVLRSYLRQRAMLVSYAGHHIQHMQKALTQMNLKLQHVVSDVTGVTGMAIRKAVLHGERDPEHLAKLRTRHCQHTEAEIARALQGNWRAEHLFALQQAVELYEFYHRQIEACDRQIAAHLQTFADKSEGKTLPHRPRKRKRGATEPRFAARAPLFRLSGVDLTAIEGIEENTALVLLSEIGTDMNRWPSEKHFAAWLGLCPHHKISGGKVLSRKVRPGANRAALALRLAANCLHQSQSALGAFFRRLKARLGTPKAIVATAHKLARLGYRLLKYGEAYVAQGMAEYEQAYRERTVQNLVRKAKALGYKLLPVTAAATQEAPA